MAGPLRALRHQQPAGDAGVGPAHRAKKRRPKISAGRCVVDVVSPLVCESPGGLRLLLGACCLVSVFLALLDCCFYVFVPQQLSRLCPDRFRSGLEPVCPGFRKGSGRVHGGCCCLFAVVFVCVGANLAV